MTPIDSPLPSASSLPRSFTELAHWLDAKEDELAEMLTRQLNAIEASPDGVPEAWEAFISDELAPFLGNLHRDASVIAAQRDEDPRFAGIVNMASDDYVRNTINRFRQLGTELWNAARKESLSAAVKDSIEEQARTIARTEVAAAFARGEHAGIEALPDEEKPDRHMWLSMRDPAVRPTHVAVDGEVVPYGVAFLVGGWPMMHPHDPAGPPGETVNCRCVEVFLFPGDDPPGVPVINDPPPPDPSMRPATDEERKALKIPPGWRNVEISGSPEGLNGLIARGRDSKNRVVSMYSAAHTERQAAIKYQRVQELFGHLDSMDRQLVRGAKKSDTDGALMLIRKTGMRPGSLKETGAKVQAFGATTLKVEHVTLRRGAVEFNFVGKKGVKIHLVSEDPELVSMIRRQVKGKGPGDRLFNTSAEKVTDRLHELVPPKFKTKDLRTVRANTVALREIENMPLPTTQREFEAARKQVAQVVSSELGNTPSVALESYINPTVFGRWTRALG